MCQIRAVFFSFKISVLFLVAMNHHWRSLGGFMRNRKLNRSKKENERERERKRSHLYEIFIFAESSRVSDLL